MLVEFTDGDGISVLINSEHISAVREGRAGQNVSIWIGTDIRINVRQSFEETKKRLGLAITPRAETLAIR